MSTRHSDDSVACVRVTAVNRWLLQPTKVLCHYANTNTQSVLLSLVSTTVNAVHKSRRISNTLCTITPPT